MKGTSLRGLVCGLFLFSGVAGADSIANLGGSGGSLQSFPGALTEGASPGAYWDNQSQDGSHKNLGYFVTGQSGYPNSPNLTNPQWVGNGNSASNSLSFNSTGINYLT